MYILDFPSKKEKMYIKVFFHKILLFCALVLVYICDKTFSATLLYILCKKFFLFLLLFLHILILSQIWCAHKSKIDRVSTERVFSRYYVCNKCHRLRLLCIKKDSNKLLLQTVEN